MRGAGDARRHRGLDAGAVGRAGALAPALVLALVSSVAGCASIDARPSEGRCTGFVGPLPIDFEIDADASELHRVDEVLFGEDGVVSLSYGDGAIVVEALWNDMPMATDVGEHPIPTAGLAGDGLIESWTTILDGNEVVGGVREATLALDASGRDRIVGAFALTFQDESVLTCTFDLRRAVELEG